MTSAVEVLTKARALIEKGWTQGTNARQKNNRETSPQSKTACKFCAIGAMVREANLESLFSRDRRSLATRLDHALAKVHPEFIPDEDNSLRAIAQFNDLPTTTKEQILEVYDHAIRQASADQGQGFNSAA